MSHLQPSKIKPVQGLWTIDNGLNDYGEVHFRTGLGILGRVWARFQGLGQIGTRFVKSLR